MLLVEHGAYINFEFEGQKVHKDHYLFPEQANLIVKAGYSPRGLNYVNLLDIEAESLEADMFLMLKVYQEKLLSQIPARIFKEVCLYAERRI